LRDRTESYVISRRPSGKNAPLSFSQQRIWFYEQLSPGSPVYNRPVALRLTGPLDVPAFERTLNDIIGRHEALRTTVLVDHGTPVQVVSPAQPLKLDTIDTRSAPVALREVEARRRVEEEARRPFDLAHGPLVRALLIRTSDTEHILVLTFHHIIFDGWSAGVLVRELAQCYSAYAAGVQPALAELPVQLADYAVWQHESLRGERLDRHIEYWCSTLTGTHGVLDLPTDCPRRRSPSTSGARQSTLVPNTITDGLRRLSRQDGVTPFMILLAAFATLLHRYTDEEDIVVGCPIAGRTRVELEPLIGCFINTLPLRVDLTGNPSFRTLLRRVRETALGAFTHQDLPLQTLIEAVRPERDPSRSPLFQVIFNLRNLPDQHDVQFSGLHVEDFDLDVGTSIVDLTLEITPHQEGLHTSIEYSTDLFFAETVSRMHGHFRTLLDAIVADPGCRLSELPLLTDLEQQALVRLGRGDTIHLPEDLCPHQLVEAQVVRTPDALAVVHGTGRLTYDQLNRRANQLAHRLHALGVGPEVIVGVCIERSLDMTVALLGVLKAGGACVPLDATYPVQRLTFMLNDAAPSVLLTQQQLAERLPLRSGMTVICLDSDTTLGTESMQNPISGVTGANLAYVIYTSGSTGMPKGVQVTHRALVNVNLVSVREYGIGPLDRVLQFSSISFDGSVDEIFPTWISGATLVLRSDEMLGSGAAFIEAIARERITVLDLPTAFWHEWARELPAGNLRLPETLRLVVVGGEKASAEVLRVFAGVAGRRVRWLNAYGPAETTLYSTLWDPGEDLVAAAATDEVPIGRPIANTHVAVRDRFGRLVPVGIPGELHIGGVGVARGYLNREELTAERFVPDPFTGAPDAMLYKTGDRVRLRMDGILEFLGRFDRQVKLRGYRIEPMEIETALRSHAAVDNAVVVLHEDPPGDARLVAYVVLSTRAHPEPHARELRRFLQDRLPAYMLPSAIVRLDALPMSGSGKVDYRALPAPDKNRDYVDAGSFVAARNAFERGLAVIWEELLGVQRVGVTDNFFELGGHSLLAVRLMARIEQEFGKRLPLSVLFEGATIEHLARIISRGSPAARRSPLVAIQPSGSKRPLFCVHEFFGDIFLYDLLARCLGKDQPFYGLQASGLDGEQEPTCDIAEMAALYIDAIRTVQPEGPFRLGGLCAGGLVAFEMAQQLRALGEEVSLLALLDSSAVSFVSPQSHVRNDSTITDLFRGFLDWFNGMLQLTSEQWRDLIRLQARLGRAMIAASIRAMAAGTRLDDAAVRTQTISKLFELSGYHLHVAGAFRQALADYAPKPYAGRAVLFRARMQPLFGTHDPAKGWRSLITGGLDIRVVPGNHLGMLQEPHVRVLARELADALAEQGPGQAAAIATGAIK